MSHAAKRLQFSLLKEQCLAPKRNIPISRALIWCGETGRDAS